MATQKLLIKGGTLVTLDKKNRVSPGSILVENGRISEIGEIPATSYLSDTTCIDASDCLVLPGFVQAHIHLAQTLFRGFAEDLALLDWLKERIWPLEAAHNESSLRLSTRLGLAELLASGTTCALDMGTVHFTDVIFEEARKIGFRLTSGKAMMDQNEYAPKNIIENTRVSIDDSLTLAKNWHLSDDGRLRYAFAPRFVLSCSEELMVSSAEVAREQGCFLHTHASECEAEVSLLRKTHKQGNVELLHSLGFSGSDTLLAHCVYLSPKEVELLRNSGTNVAHCPSANAKLGSGIADILGLLGAGVRVGLGSDGAPCNNRLNIFDEMRMCGMLQKLKHGASAMSASQILKMATIDGAKCLGLQDEIGSLEVGKRADIVIVARNTPHSRPFADEATFLVYACSPEDIKHVLIDGRILVKDREFMSLDKESLFEGVEAERASLFERASL